MQTKLAAEGKPNGVNNHLLSPSYIKGLPYNTKVVTDKASQDALIDSLLGPSRETLSASPLATDQTHAEVVAKASLKEVPGVVA